MKITNLVGNWQKLIYDKQSYNTDGKIEELENKLKEQERLTQESNNLVHDLYKKMEERKTLYDKSVAELNAVVQSLKEQIKASSKFILSKFLNSVLETVNEMQYFTYTIF